MKNLIRFDPWREMLGLRDAMKQLFEQSFVRPSWFGALPMVRIPIHIYETKYRPWLPGPGPPTRYELTRT
jgi:HSP20 family protein